MMVFCFFRRGPFQDGLALGEVRGLLGFLLVPQDGRQPDLAQ